MKKLVLLSLVMSISFFGFAQERISVNKSLKNISKTAVHITATDEVVDMPIGDVNPYVSNFRDLEGENIVGRTLYDLQSNSLLSNRISIFPDGSIGAVWTRGVEGAPGFADRGTGYNFFDGTSWGPEPETRIEDVRTGWPSYAALGTDGEIVISHEYPDRLVVNTREQKGAGEWNYSSVYGPEGNEGIAWPRIITAGEDNNSIHLLVSSYDEYEGQTIALFYYRSLDGGESWDVEAEILEGMGPDYYNEIGADQYVWAEENGGNIAFLIGGAWHDLFMMKSSDNGESWEKTVIWEHPYPFFDWEATIADTFYCVDNSASITLDSDGMAHVAFGISRVMHLEVGTTYNYFPWVDGVGYWNESMPTFSNNHHALSPYSDDPESELVENVSLVGWTQDVNGSGELEFLEELMSYRELGFSTMPSISSDESGALLLAFSSTTETFDNTINNYKHVWVRTKDWDGYWGAFQDLDSDVAHMFDECIYPIVAQNMTGNYANILYQADFDPGTALDDDHAYVENRYIVANYSLLTGVVENESTISNFTVSQNIPNPAVNSTSIVVNSETTGNISLSISNLLGQVVYQENVVSNSHSHEFNVDVTNLDSGIYFYTIEIGNQAITNKMLVK